MDKNIVLGLFTYENDSKEIDLEFSRWGNPSTPAGWYVIQPSSFFSTKNFPLNLTGDYTTHNFNWKPSVIHFQSFHGHGFNNLIEQWKYEGSQIPESGHEKVHINLWLQNGVAPSDRLEVEVIIKSFSFTSI